MKAIDFLILAPCRDELTAVLHYMPKSKFVESRRRTGGSDDVYTTTVAKKSIVICPLSYHKDVAEAKTKHIFAKYNPFATLLVCTAAAVGKRMKVGDSTTLHGFVQLGGPLGLPLLEDHNRERLVVLGDKPASQSEARACRRLPKARCFAHHGAAPAVILREASNITICVGISMVAGSSDLSQHNHHMACWLAAQECMRVIDTFWKPTLVACPLCKTKVDPTEPVQR